MRPGSTLRGVFSTTVVCLNTCVCVAPLMFVTGLKLLVPLRSFRDLCTHVLIWIAETWVAVNSWCLDWALPTRWEIEGLEGLDPEGYYLVACNHQSWADIPVLQRVFHRRIPFLKFFLKQELIWVPMLGVAWWALDFPFMKRYSRAQLERHPELRGKDLETTRKACRKFEHQPVTILNFLEGTRFTPGKHAHQGSPHRHLLKPKAGGLGFVLGALGSKITTFLDVTIVYGARPHFWDFLCGRLPTIQVRVEALEIPAELLGRDYLEDEAFRDAIQQWVRERWEAKDALIEELKG
ncbi:MAG: acyltransferase [Deltaproteobacteria bacterium]|nr:acyltransferase [Deltaproteobacteria bacterium]